MRSVSPRSFILSAQFPGGRWDVAVDLDSFYRLLENDELVKAMVHVGNCMRPECSRLRTEVEGFLNWNRHYPFEILRALAGCRGELRKRKPRAC